MAKNGKIILILSQDGFYPYLFKYYQNICIPLSYRNLSLQAINEKKYYYFWHNYIAIIKFYSLVCNEKIHLAALKPKLSINYKYHSIAIFIEEKSRNCVSL